MLVSDCFGPIIRFGFSVGAGVCGTGVLVGAMVFVGNGVGVWVGTGVSVGDGVGVSVGVDVLVALGVKDGMNKKPPPLLTASIAPPAKIKSSMINRIKMIIMSVDSLLFIILLLFKLLFEDSAQDRNSYCIS